MKFTVISHAGLLVEGDGGSVLFDPWLVGSCYWRSWWNYPEPSRELIRSLRPSAIYLTHLHWDHFHAPSLRLFDRSTRVLVPRMPTDRMVRDLAQVGFHHVEEIPHGGSVELWPGCRLHAFQFGAFFTDSAAVVSDGRTTLLNANDCKVFGLPLRQITRRFPRVDFCFRSHSSAGPLPYCVEGWQDRFADHRRPADHAEEFSRFALAVGARHAVPFASNHCFLHDETLQFNDTATNPDMVTSVFERVAREAGSAARCVVMPPGSSWDSSAGFDLAPFDYAQREAHVRRMRETHREALERQARIEQRVTASFPAFEAYFRAFVSAIPRWAPRRLRPRMLFEVADASAAARWFLVDCAARRVEELADRAAAGDVDFEIRTPALVLNDCVRKKMFSSWTPGKRLRIRVRGESLAPVSLFLGMLDMFEGDMLPLRANVTRRAIGERLRRWREPVEAARLLVRHRLLRRPFSIAGLYPAPRADGP